MTQSSAEQQQLKIEGDLNIKRAEIDKLTDLRSRLHGEDWKLISAYITRELATLRQDLLDCDEKWQKIGRLQGRLAELEAVADLGNRLDKKIQSVFEEAKRLEASLSQHKQRRMAVSR